MILSDYRLLAQIGAGRDGISYRAQVDRTGEPVEVRVLSAARAHTERWPSCVRRLLLAAMIEHPAVQRILKCRLESDTPFVALEPVEAPSLPEALVGQLPLAVEDAIRLTLNLAEALAAAHRLGLAHGALSPSAAKLRTEHRPILDLTALQVVPLSEVPSPLDTACRPPESTGDAASDVYALGSILAWLLHGEDFLAWKEQGVAWRSLAVTSANLGADGSTAVDSLEQLVRELRAIDAAERPTAPQVVERLMQLRAVHRVPAGLAATGALPSCLAETSGEKPRGRHDRATPEEDLLRRGQLGRFRLLEKLGQGGMGAVYKAEDLADASLVAIKVLRRDWAETADALKRFRKEARLLAEVSNPYVANLIEMNEDAGVHYLAIEYVAGQSLDKLLKTQGKFDEATAVAVAADVCRALLDAHRRGIVHRDVKPDNILVSGGVVRGKEVTGETDHSLLTTYDSPTIKLSDFGLARHVVESESLQMTQAGSILGTPLYMSPEQCSGEAVDPRADVYSLGATLFHLLAGRPPFLSDSALALIGMHCHEPPPSLKTLVPELSDGVCRIVEKALTKSPAMRYADAAALLHDLERLLKGEPTSIVLHPQLPACDPKNVLHYDWILELNASPAQLWPFVSNTERFNRAAGVPPVEFSAKPPVAVEAEAQLRPRVRRQGQFHKLGMHVQWEEHPFEWVEGRRFGVLREYTSGPFKWLMSVVELTPRVDGGTTLAQRVRIEPAGLVGKAAAAVEVALKGRRAAERVYRRIDAALTGKLGHAALVDPFEEAPALSGAKRRRLDDLIARIEQRGVDPATAERLGDFLATAPDQEVARIRPLVLARRLELVPQQVVAACLHGAHEGLLVLLWDLLCPICRIPSEVQDTLKALNEHGRCEACNFDYELDFASSVEMIFRVHPEIRTSELQTYCIGGPAHFPHVVAQLRVGSGERLEVELALAEGAYRLRGPQLPYTVDFQVQPHASLWRLDWPLPGPPDPLWKQVLRAGSQLLVLSNEHNDEIVVRVERAAQRSDALTAARAASLALFRELFPGEVLSPRQLMNVSMVTFLVTEIESASVIYRSLGDVQAFGVIHEHFRLLEDEIRRQGGALVKTVGEGLLAAFSEARAAVSAALSLAQTLKKHETTRDLRLKVGVHRGAVMAATLNDHLDYFGTAVNTAWQLVRHAHGNEVLLTEPVAGDPQVAALLCQRGIEGEVVERGPLAVLRCTHR